MAFNMLFFFKFGVDNGSTGHEASPPFYQKGEVLTIN